RQGGFGVRAVQDLLLRKRVNRANAVLPSDEADLGLLDRPVHTGTSPPAIDRLIGRQPVAQAVPRLLACVRHCLYEMHVELLSSGTQTRKARGFRAFRVVPVSVKSRELGG